MDLSVYFWTFLIFFLSFNHITGQIILRIIWGMLMWFKIIMKIGKIIWEFFYFFSTSTGYQILKPSAPTSCGLMNTNSHSLCNSQIFDKGKSQRSWTRPFFKQSYIYFLRWIKINSVFVNIHQHKSNRLTKDYSLHPIWYLSERLLLE